MTDTAPIKTLILAVGMFVFCVFFMVTADFGYTDMFYRSMTVAWLFLTLASFLPLEYAAKRFVGRATPIQDPKTHLR